MVNRATQPILCNACDKMIYVGQVIIRHHVTYFPEQIVIVHVGCHNHIHMTPSKYPHLKPDPRQVTRWYKKLNHNRNIKTELWPWQFAEFWNNLWFTIMTEEERNQWKENQVKEYWQQAENSCREKERCFILELNL